MIQKAKGSGQRHSSVDSLLKSARRADVAGSGIVKALSPQQAKKVRWSTMGGVINGRVVMPDSPSMTLPELLHEAEVSLTTSRAEDSPSSKAGYSTPRVLKTSWRRDPFLTPAPSGLRARSTWAETSLYIDTAGPRDWMKNDWKLLDACFTDERLASGRNGAMADAGTVDLEEVIKRFVTLMGGEDAIRRMGASWTKFAFSVSFSIEQRETYSHHTGMICSHVQRLYRRSRILDKWRPRHQLDYDQTVGFRLPSSQISRL